MKERQSNSISSLPTPAQNARATASETHPRKTMPALSKQHWISFTLRRLEPWVAWSIAAYTAWLALFAFPGVYALWLYVCYAGLIGEWCRVHPARHPPEMFLRGVALIAGAYMLHTHTNAELGGAGGVFFFWLSITTLYYAFMLRPLWASGLIVAALAEYILSTLQTSGLDTALPSVLVQGGFLCVFPLILAMKFGVAMRRPDEAVEKRCTDRSTGLYNKLGLVEHGDELLASYHLEKRSMTLAAFSCSELRELREIHGRAVADKILKKAVSKFNLLAGELGLAARTDAAEFAVMLPCSAEKAFQLIAREFGTPPRIEHDVGNQKAVLFLGLVAEVAGPKEFSIGELYDRLSADLRELEIRTRIDDIADECLQPSAKRPAPVEREPFRPAVGHIPNSIQLDWNDKDQPVTVFQWVGH